MSKLTTDEYEMYSSRKEKYLTITLGILAKHMHKTEILIDQIRLVNRRLGDKFVGHYCLCNENQTVWKFIYRYPANSNESDAIYNELTDIFNFVYEEEINVGEASVGDAYISEHSVSPCVCPYSMR